MYRMRWFLAVFALTATAPAFAAPSTTLSLDTSSGRPVVEVWINDEGPYHLALDTGAAGTVIGSHLRDRLGLESTGTDMVGDPSGRNRHAVDLVTIDAMRLGDLGIGPIEASVLDFGSAMGHHGQPPFDGVLSVTALKGQLVTFDLASESLLLEPGGELESDGDHVVPYYLEGGVPWIAITAADLTLRAFLDSGSPGEISMAHALADHLELSEPLRIVGHARTVSSEFDIYAAPLVGAVEVAGHRLERPTLMFDGLHRGTQANLGSAFLRRFIVTLDLERHLVRFEAGGAPAS